METGSSLKDTGTPQLRGALKNRLARGSSAQMVLILNALFFLLFSLSSHSMSTIFFVSFFSFPSLENVLHSAQYLFFFTVMAGHLPLPLEWWFQGSVQFPELAIGPSGILGTVAREWVLAFQYLKSKFPDKRRVVRNLSDLFLYMKGQAPIGWVTGFIFPLKADCPQPCISIVVAL